MEILLPQCAIILLHTGKVLEDPRKTKGGCWGFIRGCSRESLLWWCWCWGEKPAGASNGGFEVEVMHNSQSSVTQKVVKICQYRINSFFLVLDLLLISFLFTWRNWWQILWKFDFSCQHVSATSMQNKKEILKILYLSSIPIYLFFFISKNVFLYNTLLILQSKRF